MSLFLKKKYFLLLLVIFVFGIAFFSPGRAMVDSRDELSNSAPGLASNHSIRFVTSDAIPPSGRIDVVLPSGFTLPIDFDYGDIDFAVAFSQGGPHLDRDLIDYADPNLEQVTFFSDAEKHRISFILNANEGIPAGRYISIELGTNALFGAFGTSSSIINPGTVGPQNIDIESYDESGNFLERTGVSVFIIEPVTMSNYVTKKRSGASPVGWLGFGTSQTIISLYTNYKAVCRYSTASNTPFALMTNEFTYLSSTTDSYYHTKLISGLSNGAAYNFYVRCQDEFGVADDFTECRYTVASTSPFFDAEGNPLLKVDCVDYPIVFRISSISGATGDESGSPGNENVPANKPGKGSAGGGGGGGAGALKGEEKTKGEYLPYPPPLGASGVAFKGWSFPLREVYIVRDGTEEGYTKSDANGVFAAFLETINRGIYTFNVWSKDTDNRKSAPYSTTFWMEAGTRTEVVDIIIPPTIELVTKNIQPAGVFSLLGQSIPNGLVEVSLYPKKENLKDSEIIKKEVTVDNLGKWQAQIGGAGSSLSPGTYRLKARAKVGKVGYSGYSTVLEGLVEGGVVPETPIVDNSLCAGADLNSDGKVNITDFSILLYHWGGSDACADQNHNGKVELADFSIMMYNWTG